MSADLRMIVPVEPTREMWAAGGTAACHAADQHHDKVVEGVWSAMLAAAPPSLAGAVKWHRLGDVLPEYGRPLLIASKREGEDFWRVRDAHLYRRYEGVYASLDHLKGGEFAENWWFNSIYPGTNDLRLAHEDLLWAYMPTPDDAPAEAQA